jgi:hypothetical protein
MLSPRVQFSTMNAPEPIGAAQFSSSVRFRSASGDWIPKYPWDTVSASSG